MFFILRCGLRPTKLLTSIIRYNQRGLEMGAHFDHVADDYVDHGESVRVRLLTVLMFVEPRGWDESTDHAG